MTSTHPLRQGKAGYLVNEVILHTSDTAEKWWRDKTVEQMRDEIDLWHRRDRGWRAIGYHGVFAPDGTFSAGRPLTQIGAHVAERNRGTIGLCLIPIKRVTKVSNFDDYYTEEQRQAVRRFIASLPGIRWVTGHNDYAARLCPGFTVRDKDWL